MSDAVDQATRQVGTGMLSRFSAHGLTAGKNFGGAFGSSLAMSIPVVSGFSSAMSGYEGAAGKAGALAGRALGMAFTTAAAGLIGAAGYTLFKGFERYQSIDEARVRLENLNKTLEATGRMQLDVGAVMSTVNEAVTGTRFSLDQAFSVATRALSSATGPLDRFMKVAADGAAFAGGQISDIGNALIKVANQGKLSAGELQNEFIDLPIAEWLAATMGKSTAEITKMITESKVGLNDLMTAIEFGAKDMAKGSANSISGAIEQAKTAVSRLGANFLGAMFGQPTDEANTLIDSINSLAERLNQVNAWVVANQDGIRDFFAGAVDIGKALFDLVKDIADALGGWDNLIKVAGGAFVAWKAIGVISTVGSLVTSLGTISTLLKALPALATAAGTKITAALAAISAPAWLLAALKLAPALGVGIGGVKDAEELGLPLWDEASGTFIQPGQSAPGAPGANMDSPLNSILLPGGNAPTPMLPGQGLHWEDGKGWVTADGSPPPFMSTGPGGVPSGSPILDPTGADGGSGPRLPAAPVVPYDTSLPPGIPGMPPDASVYSAESSFLDTRHKLAEKKARLNQLEASNEATADEVLNARNEVAATERDLTAAEMRMHDARNGQMEKLNKQTKKLTADLGELGASLDADFGISKGLAGIAENITKFVANLAAAPLLGKLGAVSAAAPTQGGHGVMGVMGARGAFGPQYLNNQYAEAEAKQAKASNVGPVPLQPGVATAIPGGTPKQYQQGMVPNNVNLLSVLEQMFPGVKMSADTGRQDKFGEHGSGEALDIMVGNNAALGDKINQFLLSNADALGLQYNIWKQATWRPDGSVKPMEDRGSPTQNHMDHVHARVKPGPAGPGGSVMSAPAMSAPASASAVLAASSGGPVSVYVVNMPAGGVAMPFPGGPAAPGGGVHGATPASPGPGNFGTGTGQGVPGMAGPPQAGAMPFGTPQPATRIGGGPGLSGSGSGGVGIGGGAMDAAMMAAGGLDMLAPGAGQVAQTGMKLANRAIEFGGQAVGIGAQGLMDTFLPFGGSELASNNWITKIAGGLAGAAPAMPNLAGNKSEPPLQGADPNAAQQGQAQGGGDTNITVNNQRPTEDGTGRDIAYHLQNQHAAPGM